MGMTEEGVIHFHRHGFVVVRGLIDITKLSKLAFLTAEHLANAKMARGYTSLGQPKYIPHRPDFQSLYFEDVMRRELIEEIFQSRSVIQCVRRLTKKREVFTYPTKLIRAVPPEHVAYFKPAGIHQDFPEVQGGESQITLWAPLFPTREDSGSLPVYGKGHYQGVLPLQLADNHSGWEVDVNYLGGRSVFDLSPGDALLFSSLTPHGGSSNSGQGWRVSIEARYQPLSQPISEGNLKKPIAFDNWEEQYRGWSEFGDYWVNRHPPLIKFDDTWERWRDLESIREALKSNPLSKTGLMITSKFGRSHSTRSAARELLKSLDF
jgi:ectoine hydroxylase-related dioxygenase (phytanoyl-CoA dioxygenase family)